MKSPRLLVWVTVLLFLFFQSFGVRAWQIFYSVDFNSHWERINGQASSNMGRTNQPAYFPTGYAPVVSSFGHLTNYPMLFGAFGGIFFDVGRGAPNYFIECDFETHNLATSSQYFVIGLWNQNFALHGQGEVLTGIDGVDHDIGWADDHAYHLHIDVNRTEQRWTLQLGQGEPLTGALSETQDILAAGFTVSPGFGTFFDAEVAIDNIRIGTTAQLFPLRTVRWFDGFDGAQPNSTLITSENESLYGTTEIGGDAHHSGSGYGTVFKMKRNGATEWVFRFDGTNGSDPQGGLTSAAGGDLFGTTAEGGKFGLGTAFKITEDGDLVWSTSFHGKNGAHPRAALIDGLDGFLYGTTADGGTGGFGTLFRLSARTGEIEVIHTFGGDDDGAGPLSRLTQDSNGILYGTTSMGGSPQNGGTIFKVTPTGHFTTLCRFEGANGLSPKAGLTFGSDGALYGSTAAGGLANAGTLFRITRSGQFTQLMSFTPELDGAAPQAELVSARDGKLYGVALLGGGFGDFIQYGSIFRITTSGEFQRLTSFHGGDGSFPRSALLEVAPGKFYGVASGGSYSAGNLFSFAIKRPSLVITEPHTKFRFAEPFVTMAGKSKGVPSVTKVFCQVNGQEWLTATTTNSWTNWTASVALSVGKNLLRAYAINSLGDASRTNSVILYYRPGI